MKQCPECNEVFSDQKAFCDIDGSELSYVSAPPRSATGWVTGAIGGLIGVIVCVLLYMAFLAPNRQDIQDQARRAGETKETAPSKPGQVAVAPLQSQVPATETASPAETGSPTEAEPAPAESPAAPATTPAPAALNNGPIATGGKLLNGNERAIIKMKDGSSVEADAAWEDSQGVWYRRSGLVSFVERSRVEAITEPPRRPAAVESKTP